MVLSKPHADVVSASISLLDSCVNTYHALGAIHRQQHAVLNHGRPHDRTNHTRDAVLAGHNGAVAEVPPVSDTTALAVENRGVQAGMVMAHTRMSPAWTLLASGKLCTTFARPCT